MNSMPRPHGRLSPSLLILAILAGCTSANPLATSFPDAPYSEEKMLRGVVNGFWEFDPDRNMARLQSPFAKADKELAKELADRHLIRVGINRSIWIGRSLEVVALPNGWTYSLVEPVDDGKTINIGDVVDVRGHVGTNVESVVSIVRKCNATPLPDENKNWSIGCKHVDSFDANGYGEKYYWTAF
jgi:hypothetical protein